MTTQIAIVVQIQPGERSMLQRVFEQGPPFDLAAEGFEHHEVFLGDADVVFVFTAPGAMSPFERLAASRALLSELVKMSTLLTAPRILNRTFAWQREAVEA